MINLSVRIELFEEGDVYVAVAPELNISSFGDTIEDAKASLRQAIELFVEECQEMGTLDGVLEESGFSRIHDSWTSRRPLFQEDLALAV